MKKIIPIICLLLVSKFNFSQASFALLDSTFNVTGTIITIPVTANNSYQTELRIQNLTGNSITYKVDRVYLTPPVCSGNDIFFCAAGNCFPPDSATIIFSSGNDNILAFETLPSSSTNFGILADYFVGSNCCSEDVLYKVYDANNPNNFASVTLRYQCSIGINDLETVAGTISNAFPNPANSIVSIRYILNDDSQKGKIVIYDLSGKLVKEVQLDNARGVAKIDISSINAGAYFYSLVVDGKASASKKLVVIR